MQRRVQARVPLPWIQPDPHGSQPSSRPAARAVRFERHPARLERLPAHAPADGRHSLALRCPRPRRITSSIVALARDGNALEPLVTNWYAATSGVDEADPRGRACRQDAPKRSIRCCVLALRPFLARCAEALMQRADFSRLATRALPGLRMGTGLRGDHADAAIGA